LDEGGKLLCEGDAIGQAHVVFDKIQRALNGAGMHVDDIVKLNLFFVNEKEDISADFHSALNAWKKFAPNSKPAMTAVRVYELSSPGVEIQADCVAIKR
jgi:enamine deaminase RidA (YjgF/YER057c/UK114 family)